MMSHFPGLSHNTSPHILGRTGTWHFWKAASFGEGYYTPVCNNLNDPVNLLRDIDFVMPVYDHGITCKPDDVPLCEQQENVDSHNGTEFLWRINQTCAWKFPPEIKSRLHHNHRVGHEVDQFLQNILTCLSFTITRSCMLSCR